MGTSLAKELRREAADLDAQADIAHRVGISLTRFSPVLASHLSFELKHVTQNDELRLLLKDLRPRVGHLKNEDERTLALVGGLMGLVVNNACRLVEAQAAELEATRNKLIGRAELKREMAKAAAKDELDEPDSDGRP